MWHKARNGGGGNVNETLWQWSANLTFELLYHIRCLGWISTKKHTSFIVLGYSFLSWAENFSTYPYVLFFKTFSKYLNGFLSFYFYKQNRFKMNDYWYIRSIVWSFFVLFFPVCDNFELCLFAIGWWNAASAAAHVSVVFTKFMQAEKYQVATIVDLLDNLYS